MKVCHFVLSVHTLLSQYSGHSCPITWVLIVEALQILKDSYRSGDLGAGSEALTWEGKA